MSLDRSKPTAMLEFNAAAQPSLEDVKKKFKLSDNEIDDNFGVLPLKKSNAETTYVVLVSEEAALRIQKKQGPGKTKASSNPAIVAL